MTLADITPFLPFLSALVAGIPMALIVFRGRSMFPLHYRLWRLTHRKDDVNAEWLDTPIRERTELMKCRSLLIQADSYPQARRIGEWAASHDVDLGTLGECGTYFNRDALSMADKVPAPANFGLVAMVPIYVAILFMIFGVKLAQGDEAMFSLKASGRTLFVSSTTARHFGGERFLAMSLKDCATKDDPAGLGADRTDACDILADPRLGAAVAENVQTQRVFGIALALCGALMIALMYIWGRAVRAATAVKDQIRRKVEELAGAATLPVESANDGDRPPVIGKAS